MAKKKSWFNLLKTFFVSGSESRLDKGKRKGWVFTRLKIRRLVATSVLSPPRERRHQKAEEKQNKHAIKVDVETINESNADAETPIVEAEIATFKEGIESICHRPKNETLVLSKMTIHGQETKYFYLYERRIENLAAIKIQTAFRGYLARKALRALKGLVRLQAIVRGRAVRRQAIATLRSLQSIVNIQSEVCAKRCDNQVKTTVHCQENTLLDLGEKDIKIDLNSQKRWDNRYLSKEEANKMFSSKREAAIKRERIREYWLSHRRSTESDVNGRRRYWLEQWVDAQLAKRDDLKNVDTLFSARNREEFERKEMKPKTSLRQYHTDQELVSPVYVPRRSFHHRRQKSSGDHDNTFMGSPSIPTYMAATESAKAKARSMSSPRLRPINTDVYSEINSPYKYKLSPISSINSDATVTSRIGSVPGFSQRSPCLKATPGPIKSTRSIKDLSFGSDGAFANWDCIGACR
ncbi:protein IQ-DOMAIN 11 isoform X3 [Solanum stenotomum]|uniref:protein IQ-DOMAIN 11 isoform X3 n=1 Tax=Solanum stenotomum TaxID=172797 RepID=UPI0020D17CDE|nr:protein IQ-DOMAIN 11 isoform X3 [Solanum stenotomum]